MVAIVHCTLKKTMPQAPAARASAAQNCEGFATKGVGMLDREVCVREIVSFVYFLMVARRLHGKRTRGLDTLVNACKPTTPKYPGSDLFGKAANYRNYHLL